MTLFKLKFITSFIIVLITVAALTTFVPAQNSRLQNLINDYKAQNPNKLNQNNPNPNPHSNPNFYANPTPPQPNQHQPSVPYPYLASQPNTPNTNPNTTQPNTRQNEILIPEQKVHFGNPRDPLNLNFDPTWHNSPNRKPLPCDEMLSDARINDVFFVNSLTGWAVGDRGLIWHTNDGGKSWQLQQTPISCILKSVWFTNEQIGIIVGGYRLPYSNKSKGIIFVTFNSGQNWNTLKIDGTPFFHHVKMFDHLRGIIAGESSEHCPSGLFVTKDGGRTWHAHQTDKTDGWINADFIDEKTGIGINTQNEIYPTNFNNKINLPNEKLPNKNNTKFNQVKFAKIETKLDTVADIKNINASAVVDDSSNQINGWLVGGGGCILKTTDKGLNWNLAVEKLPIGEAAMNLDLSTIEVVGDNIWVAGSPGTFVYHSNDAGKTWKATPSGINATIRKIVFVDNLNGWAVGDLGTIIATTDGGLNWTTQRTGAKRLAVLGVFGKTSEKIPFEAFVHLCANQGYIGGATFIFRDKMQYDNSKHIENAVGIDAAHEAMLRVGASTAFELTGLQTSQDDVQTTYEQLINQINKNTNNKETEQIRKNLVCAIRQWQPDVIIGTNINSTKNPVREFVLREIMEAVKLAADASVYPEQITQLGLTTWQVKKVHLALLDESSVDSKSSIGEINIRTTDPLVRLGGSISEAAYISHGLVEREWWAKPAVLGFTTPFDIAPTTGNLDLFAGIDAKVNIAKRFTITDYSAHWVAVTQRIKKQQYTDRIIRDMIKNTKAKGKSLSEVQLVSYAEELTRKVDRDCAVQTLTDIGRCYHANGDIESAAEAYGIIVNQYADHPLAGHALLWTLQYYAAEETGWREILKNPSTILSELPVKNAYDIPPNKTNTPPTYNNTNYTIIPATATVREQLFSVASQNNNNLSQDEFQAALKRIFDFRLDKGLEFSEYARRNFPDLADDVRVRFSWASILRRRGFGQEAIRYYQIRGGESYDDVWSMRARAECKLWNGLSGEIDPATKNDIAQNDDLTIPTIVSTFTPNIPFLDGKFDSNHTQEGETWVRSKLYSLTPSKPRYKLNELVNDKYFRPGTNREKQSLAESKNFGTKVMFMYDSRHLYIGFRCPKSPDFKYPPIPERPRVRDSNISDQDRIEILIDVDRDYNTFYSWTIDSRGWVVDSYFGDKTWNSNCFIARMDDKDAWYIEMAITLDTLTGNLPAPKNVWGIGVRRIIPDVGIECWNAENSLNLGEGLGFLMFGE
ncbi:MAG: hypothetical protein LBH59_03190 [Planctomycetaceae bacterium]|jgi:photosystem II stability/assembly factor-like uncharacterized protein/tetratricopeptide (TPR) repeat protein|nr:hypothetical protein [Planctomycetaceae bacterium]